MREGWQGPDYLSLFTSEAEEREATDAYALADRLPGFTVVGLKGWDDLIVRNQAGDVFSVPAVPIASQYLAPLAIALDHATLRRDERFEGKVKWYRTPIVFGGDPNVGPNLIWITHALHREAVRSWNRIYDEMKGDVANRRTNENDAS